MEPHVLACGLAGDMSVSHHAAAAMVRMAIKTVPGSEALVSELQAAATWGQSCVEAARGTLNPEG